MCARNDPKLLVQLSEIEAVREPSEQRTTNISINEREPFRLMLNYRKPLFDCVEKCLGD
jgi:hypothetical protein